MENDKKGSGNKTECKIEDPREIGKQDCLERQSTVGMFCGSCCHKDEH